MVLRPCLVDPVEKAPSLAHLKVSSQSKALKKAQRYAKCKFVAQPEISHETAELISGSSHRRTISWYHTCEPRSRLVATRTCFSAHSVVPSTQVEASQNARRKLERGLNARLWQLQSAHFSVRAPCIVNVSSHPKNGQQERSQLC